MEFAWGMDITSNNEAEVLDLFQGLSLLPEMGKHRVTVWGITQILLGLSRVFHCNGNMHLL
jgi:hypothetical protein